MTLAFFAAPNGDVHWVNCPFNAIEAYSYYSGDDTFIKAIPNQKPVLYCYVNLKFQIEAAHTDTPVLRYKLFEDLSDLHNKCFHPAAYVRCNNNTALLPIKMPVPVLGGTVMAYVDVLLKFHVDERVKRMLGEKCSIVPKGDKFQIVSGNFIIDCEAIFNKNA